MVLNALLAIGIVVNVVKGLDLLLGTGGRRKMQSLFEWATRRLESARPIDRLKALASERGRRRVLIIGLGQFFLAVVADTLVDYWDGELDDIGSWGVLLIFGAIVLIVLVLRFSGPLGTPRLMGWLTRDTRFWPFLRRLAWFSFVGLAVIGSYQATLWGAGHLTGVGDPFATVALPIDQVGPAIFLFGIGLLIGAPPVVYFLVVTQLGWAALSASVLARIGARILETLRATAAAISERTTGAWAAVALLTTVLLGIVKLARE